MMTAMTALALGLRYFAGVFVIAFALGTIRTLWLAPAVGAVAAVAIEVPIILAVSWWWGRRLLARRPLDLAGRAVMGASAFVWLMIAEFGLAMLMGRAPGGYLASFLTPAGLLGLAGQLGFAALPLTLKSNTG
ncbi:hypothetical protein [Sandarakinorhabdus sp.]|uniref:hypothetical protein n=1 Tax=Sandarakinorhabdus sp. TaxID=1916663 RepID=UPI00333F3740